jgi:formylglycine-generating enzyme required for sulfatase activity
MAVKPFYLGVTEVTVEQFQRIIGGPEATSGDAALPARNITWEQAAEFCNQLSAEAGLQPFYRFDDSRGVRVLRFDTAANGYRLPTELEWVAANLQPQSAEPATGNTVYAWGVSSTVPRGVGNLGGSEAQAINAGAFLLNYRDQHVELATVRSYRPNWAGIYDLDGNVAEWLHDFRPAQSSSIEDGPFGPPYGSGHIVRGSHFRSTTLEELNLTRRTHSSRADAIVGFRVARSIL